MGPGDYCQLDWELATIPGPSLAATADLEGILPSEDQYLLSEDYILRPRSEWGAHSAKTSRVHLGVRKGHYPRLVRRMFDSGMITYRAPGDDVLENSVFGVWKVVDKSQRLVWAGNRSNPLFNPVASRVELHTADILAELRIGRNETLKLVRCDVSQYYNRLKAPEFLIPFLGLPRVRCSSLGIDLDTDFAVSCLRCIPMGATFAVRLAKSAFINLIRRSGFLTLSLPLQVSGRLTGSRQRRSYTLMTSL